MISVILAGGKGLRLWPESRKNHPKQLCKFVNNKSMLDHTLDRLVQAGSNHIVIITNDDLLSDINNLVQARNDCNIIEILSEPEGRNTAPAVGLVLAKYYANENDEVLGIFPADHHILDTQSFSESIQKAISAAHLDQIATIGVNPNRPETGYGYIEKTKWEIGELTDVFQVNSFCEKPDLLTATSYLETGKHMWNSGIYVGKIKTFLEEFSLHLPEIYEHLINGYDQYIKSYSLLPQISLDYGIAEKSDRMAVVVSDFGWCDLGTWNALAELYENDDMHNVCSGDDIITIDSSNCMVKQANKSIVLFGVEDLLVVESNNIIMIADRQRAQDIRNIVTVLEDKERTDLL